MDFLIVGMNHRTAPVDIRERMALSDQEIKDALAALAQGAPFSETMILSTCNRTEFYGVSRDVNGATEYAQNFLNRLRDVDYFSNGAYHYVYHNADAIRHLFRVTSGLDSMILGEPQIFGQVKDAYQLTREMDTTGPLLHRLLHTSFLVGKRIHTETRLGAGAVSVSYAAVELAGKIFQHLDRKTVLLIGAGETSELAARHLHERGVRNLLIANRTPAKAAELAASLEGRAILFEELEKHLEEADVVISATAAPVVIVTAETMRRVMARRGIRPLLVIDLAVPRDFAPEIRAFENVFLNDVDSLQTLVDRNLEKRRGTVDQAEAIIAEEAANHLVWLDELEIIPLIKALRAHFEEIRRAELAKHGKRFLAGDREQLERFTHSLIQQLLHLPTTTLRSIDPEDPMRVVRLETIRDLFHLTIPPPSDDS